MVSVHRNEPIEVLGKHSIAQITMLRENSIEARFRGVGLPTAVKEADESVTNLSNLVAVKTNDREVFFFVKVNRSVARLPVSVVADGVVHLLFDLTHERRKERRFGVWWGCLPSTLIRYTILGVCARLVDTLPTGTIVIV